MKKTPFLFLFGLVLLAGFSVWPLLGLGQTSQLGIVGQIRDAAGNPLVISDLSVLIDDLAVANRPCSIDGTGSGYGCSAPLIIQANANSGQIIPSSKHYLFSPAAQQFSVGEGGSGLMIYGKNFTANPAFSLQINRNNQGEVKVDGVVVNEENPPLMLFPPGTTVTLTARPFGGVVFTGWSGAVTSSELEVSVTLNTDKTVTANFAAAYSLSLPPVTGGSVTRSPLGVSTGGDAYLYPKDQLVTLTAVPATGYEFGGWSNEMPTVQRNLNPGTLTLTSSKTVTPIFNLISNPPGDDDPPGGEVPDLGVSSCPDQTIVVENGTWRGPSGAPLAGSPGAPINAVYSAQYKRGCLRIGSGGVLTPADKMEYELEVDGPAAVTGKSTSAGVWALGNITGTITQGVSDSRLKTNIASLPVSVRDLVMKLNPVSFNWKNTGEASLGLIAQEVEPFFPELVGRDPLDYQTLDYSALLAPLLVEIQAQDAELATLRARLNAIIYDRSN